MDTLQTAKQQVIQEIKKAGDNGYVPAISDLSVPPDPTMGDIAFPCFILAKKLKRDPNEIAVEIAAKIGPKEYIKKITSDGAYVNFHLDEKTFGSDLLQQVHKQKKSYGLSKIGEGKRVMVEFAQPNTHKAIHVGHLRNFFVGQMTIDVLLANGFEVIRTAYINDLGMHVAKALWGLEQMNDKEVPEGEDHISYLAKAYVESTKAADENEEVKTQIAKIFQELESGKGSHTALWKKTRKWSIDYIESVFDELKLDIDVWYFESDLITDTKKIIDELIEKKIVVKSEGAWIVNLEEQKCGINLLVKTDGTLLYNAKDLGLAQKKEKEYHPQRSIYVIDARQSLAMKQLFATLKLAGFDRELSHLSYEFVTLKEGAMASRRGNIIRYEMFRDRMVKQAEKETKERHEDWDEVKIKKTARAIAFSAMRFAMIKQDLDKKIVFDLDEALSFDGFTGPYLLYTFARIESLFKKAGKQKLKHDASLLAEDVEHRLLVQLSSYPETVFSVGSSLHLSVMAQYLFDLAKTFAEFYSSVPILTAEEDVKNARLSLCESVRQVLENGLKLMGIEPVEEM